MGWLPCVRGKQSTTLLFVSLSWLALFLKFLAAGIKFGEFGVMPAMTATEFGTSVALVLAIWLSREWVDKTKINAGEINA